MFFRLFRNRRGVGESKKAHPGHINRRLKTSTSGSPLDHRHHERLSLTPNLPIKVRKSTEKD